MTNPKIRVASSIFTSLGTSLKKDDRTYRSPISLRASAESSYRFIDDHYPRERLHHYGFVENTLGMLAWQPSRNTQTEHVFATPQAVDPIRPEPTGHTTPHDTRRPGPAPPKGLPSAFNARVLVPGRITLAADASRNTDRSFQPRFQPIPPA